MKQKITGKVLISGYIKNGNSFIAGYIFIAVFAVICAIIIPFPIGVIAAAVVLGAGLLIQLKLKKMNAAGNPNKSYLSVMELTDKKENTYYDSETGDSVTLTLDFGGVLLDVDSRTFKSAEPGKKYYVAFFEQNNTPFACFDADLYEPGEDVTVR